MVEFQENADSSILLILLGSIIRVNLLLAKQLLGTVRRFSGNISSPVSWQLPKSPPPKPLTLFKTSDPVKVEQKNVIPSNPEIPVGIIKSPVNLPAQANALLPIF